MSNILDALVDLSSLSLSRLKNTYVGSNRINNQGEALENLIKDIFSDSLNLKTTIEKETNYEKYFSYIGNQNNPPDLILKRSDAIEVKKIQSNSSIALNSSYPKSKLFSNDSRITNACRDCEEIAWNEKDILYVIGKVDKNSKKIEYIWMVYGDCYAASAEIYEKISQNIKSSILEMKDIEFIETNELAKVNKVDPLGITDLRVRGMWHIKNPVNVFESIFSEYDLTKTIIIALMKKEKFLELDRSSKKNIKSNKNIVIKNVSIKNPDNPIKKIDCNLIYFHLKNT